ncbi:threonine ammonia-lyase [Jiangella muralis]|uniref:threonine ammonia-lyase n=1 Tax=Jiangella muralis TaxID=702383 RepID=UPI00147037B0|nr:pyridoxal-phosphate dependent enzyme [Jiangella muralis]
MLRLASAPDSSIAIKAECLQPTGSFKVRGAGNLLSHLPGDRPPFVYTASAGNMALAMAWHAERLGIRAVAIVPETAPAAKTARIADLGAEVVSVPFDAWWQAMVDGGSAAFADGLFVHPFCDPAVIAGNAVIGLEIAAQEPGVDAVVVPFGGGGLVLGVYLGLRAAGCTAPVYAAEVETAAPFALARAAGHPVEPDRARSFVDGIGGRAVFAQIWPHAEQNLAGSVVVSIAETAAALRLVARETKLLVEGAAAAAVAAARKLQDTHARIVVVGSGGNIDHDVVARILTGADA